MAKHLENLSPFPTIAWMDGDTERIYHQKCEEERSKLVWYETDGVMVPLCHMEVYPDEVCDFCGKAIEGGSAE